MCLIKICLLALEILNFDVFLVKSMEIIDPRGMVKFPRGMIGKIYNADYQTLLHTKYRSAGPYGFRDVFSFCHFFAIVSLWRLSTPGAWPNLTPGAWLAQFEHYGQIHVCRPGAGADNPLGPKWFHKDKFSVHLPIPSKFSATTRFFSSLP